MVCVLFWHLSEIIYKVLLHLFNSSRHKIIKLCFILEIIKRKNLIQAVAFLYVKFFEYIRIRV